MVFELGHSLPIALRPLRFGLCSSIGGSFLPVFLRTWPWSSYCSSATLRSAVPEGVPLIFDRRYSKVFFDRRSIFELKHGPYCSSSGLRSAVLEGFLRVFFELEHGPPIVLPLLFDLGSSIGGSFPLPEDFPRVFVELGHSFPIALSLLFDRR